MVGVVAGIAGDGGGDGEEISNTKRDRVDRDFIAVEKGRTRYL